MKILSIILSAILLLFISEICKAQNETIDSLMVQIENMNPKSDGIGSLYLLAAKSFNKINQYDSSLKYAKLALPILTEKKIIADQGDALRLIGISYGTFSIYDSAIFYFNKAVENFIQTKDSSSLIAVYGNIGLVYNKLGEYEKATEFALKELTLAEQINDSSQIAWAANLLGSIYWYLYDNDNALKYYHKSLEIYTQLDDKFGMARASLNIGGAFQSKKQDNKAIQYYKNSLRAFEQINEKRGISAALVNLGSVYYSKKEYKKSIEYLERSLIVCEEIGDKWRYTTALNRLGQCYYFLGDYNQAKEYFILSLNNAKKVKAIKIMKDCYQNLAWTDSALGDYLSAYCNYKKYSEIKDSVFNIDKSKLITEINTKYETEKKEKEIELLNKEKAISQNKLLVQKILIISVIVILIILGIGTVLLFRRFKEKQRINNLLTSKNKEIQDKQNEIEKQNKQLEQQAKKLSELDEIKSRFFTNISHEFRTPLTLIIGPIEQLLSKLKDQEARDYLNVMLRNANKLLKLINQLLDISKIEKGSVKLKFEKADIKNELQFITEMFSSFASEKKLNLNFNFANKEFKGYIDKEKFNKIISNLLSNAFKHTQKGSINVDLFKLEKEGKIKVVVSDTGIGINKDKLPFIFDRFYQVENNETEETTGTGIGLSYIKELVQLYKGNIKVESEPGKGSSFIVELPFLLDNFENDEYEIIDTKTTIVPQVDSMNTVNSESSSDLKKSKTILIVEDHSDLRKFIADNLLEYNIIEAENGAVGIDKALKKLPDIIITDIMMPKVNGIELTKTLKNNENTSHIPIIMLTAKGSIESKMEGLETEADDYLTKPFNVKELQIRIKNLLKIRQKLQDKYNKSISVKPSEITTSSVDEKFLSKLLKTIEEHMSDSDFSVEMLCELVGMSRANIHKKLKSLLNQSATEFINSVRLKRAAQLIKQKAGNISEIAYDVGFNNLSYFSRAFKKHFNITPKEMFENANK